MLVFNESTKLLTHQGTPSLRRTFYYVLLPKCRNTETSNMFRNKPTAGSVCEGICCSFPFYQLKQNSIISDDYVHLFYYLISKLPITMLLRKWRNKHHLRIQLSYIRQSFLLYLHQKNIENNMQTIR